MAAATLNDGLDSFERELIENCDTLWDSLVDPREAFLDDDGVWWNRISAPGGGSERSLSLDIDEDCLAEIRTQCRRLAATNEFAINGIENRISYLVGTGHLYQITSRKGQMADSQLVAEVQDVIDEFVETNSWHARQQEIVRRLDRDGEAFLRFFADVEGMTRVRFIEPDQIASPSASQGSGPASFGILTDADDVESVLGYYVDGRLVDGEEIQHRKANVDFNVKRGLPLYFPVRKNLRRTERLLRNMSALAEIQSAIALIRKHRGAARSGVEPFAADFAACGNGAATGRTRRVAEYGPGTILDAPAGLEYDFPAAAVNAGAFVSVLQAELRAIAARLVMPEFMFTSDASNANYSSTLVAEGPAVKMFERLQSTLRQDDLAVLWRVIRNAASAGRLPRDACRCMEIQVTLPSLHVRDQLKECQVDETAFDKGLLSPQTWSRKLGLDYDQEQENWAMHNEPGSSDE
jgi:capsid protein